MGNGTFQITNHNWIILFQTQGAGINRINRHSQRIGRIIGLNLLPYAEEAHSHIDDLLLRRPAISGDALLDLQRGKFQNRDMGLLGREENDSPGLADGNSRRDVAIKRAVPHR